MRYAVVKLVSSSSGLTEVAVKAFRLVHNFVRRGSGYSFNRVRLRHIQCFSFCTPTSRSRCVNCAREPTTISRPVTKHTDNVVSRDKICEQNMFKILVTV
jgi:hypothetical protein